MKRIVKIVEGDYKPYYRVEFKSWWQFSWTTYKEEWKLSLAASHYMDLA